MAPAIEMIQMTKTFGNFTANDRIDLSVEEGEVHALLGENGAGKTTLMNCLYGLTEPTSGEIRIRGRSVRFSSPKHAIEAGIGMVHQHFMLVEPFTVTENIILGQEMTSWGVLDRRRAREKVVELSRRYALSVDPDAKIQDIGVGMQQRVEILKTLYRGAQILIFDEPTAVLTPQETIDLGGTIRKLTEEGKSVVIITHKLKEIRQMADRCTVIRRGKKIATVEVRETEESQLAELMVGRPVQFVFPKAERAPGESILTVESLSVFDQRGCEMVKGLNLEVKSGEILGIAGVDGNGQTELLDALTGLAQVRGGTIRLGARNLVGLTVREILDAGVSVVPEDRQKKGLVLPYTVAQNLVLKSIRKRPFSRNGLLNFKAIQEFAKKLVAAFDVRPPDPGYKTAALSGGNQQKVIIARELEGRPLLVIAAQPTRGLDVGAIEFVHKALIEQRDRGCAVLLLSLELDEILNLSDRIAVISEGKIVRVVDRASTDEIELGYWMAGGKDREN